MKVAVVGSGGREHALVRKLCECVDPSEIVAVPGNGGIEKEVACVSIKATDIDGIVTYCIKNNVEYVVVAPDDPLAMGLVDRLQEKGIAAFGPTQKAARIESSKIFAKKLMEKHGIPTANFNNFVNAADALQFVESVTCFPVVVKADGLALGKGVLICQNKAEAFDAVRSMMEEQIFGTAGSNVVIEEFLQGPEVSVLAFCDGETLVPMVSSMDHKRALDGDEGKNTGGMGAVAPNPFYNEETAERCMREIFLPTVQAMRREGAPFKGCLYFGLILTKDGPKVIEYNCRFGDPETQVVLPLLQSNLLKIMQACTNGTLSTDMVCFSPGACACVVIASGGYPDAYKSGYEIQGVADAEMEHGVLVYQAGTALSDGHLTTAGGRVLGVAATGKDLQAAINSAYDGVAKIEFTNAHFRRDIGKSALAALAGSGNTAQ